MIDIEAVKARPRTDKEMSNFDHSIDKGLEEDLRNGMRVKITNTEAAYIQGHQDDR